MKKESTPIETGITKIIHFPLTFGGSGRMLVRVNKYQYLKSQIAENIKFKLCIQFREQNEFHCQRDA